MARSGEWRCCLRKKGREESGCWFVLCCVVLCCVVLCLLFCSMLLCLYSIVNLPCYEVFIVLTMLFLLFIKTLHYQDSRGDILLRGDSHS